MPSLESNVRRYVQLAHRRDEAISTLAARSGMVLPALEKTAPKPLTLVVLDQLEFNVFTLENACRRWVRTR